MLPKFSATFVCNQLLKLVISTTSRLQAHQVPKLTWFAHEIGRKSMTSNRRVGDEGKKQVHKNEKIAQILGNSAKILLIDSNGQKIGAMTVREALDSALFDTSEYDLILVGGGAVTAPVPIVSHIEFPHIDSSRNLNIEKINQLSKLDTAEPEKDRLRFNFKVHDLVDVKKQTDVQELKASENLNRQEESYNGEKNLPEKEKSMNEKSTVNTEKGEAMMRLPIVRIQSKKRDAERKKNQAEAAKREKRKTREKEIRFGTSMSDHDLEIRYRQMSGLLDDAYRVRLAIQPRGITKRAPLAREQFYRKLMAKLQTDYGADLSIISPPQALNGILIVIVCLKGKG